MRPGTLLPEGFCGLKQPKPLYTAAHVARSIGINFWSGARNDHVLVILLYNPGNSFSLTGTRKPAGTYGRDRRSAIYEISANVFHGLESIDTVRANGRQIITKEF
ncbi:PREDICTED: uncharacterized protein LOC105453027 [Wasmannia auropunctata]|uniref:uncharacterized protein LOC105453027 n=1 Tax=Wasmannia auropunctata TaxID=64793 RepID=UPI0005EE9A0A|nr:PREDICTED: uncharacterized protein LOC105453027 [Wasmannia auropunctata]